MVKLGPYGQIQGAKMKYFLPEISMKQQTETLHFQGSTEDHIVFLLEIKNDTWKIEGNISRDRVQI